MKQLDAAIPGRAGPLSAWIAPNRSLGQTAKGIVVDADQQNSAMRSTGCV